MADLLEGDGTVDGFVFTDQYLNNMQTLPDIPLETQMSCFPSYRQSANDRNKPSWRDACNLDELGMVPEHTLPSTAGVPGTLILACEQQARNKDYTCRNVSGSSSQVQHSTITMYSSVAPHGRQTSSASAYIPRRPTTQVSADRWSWQGQTTDNKSISGLTHIYHSPKPTPLADLNNPKIPSVRLPHVPTSISSDFTSCSPNRPALSVVKRIPLHAVNRGQNSDEDLTDNSALVRTAYRMGWSPPPTNAPTHRIKRSFSRKFSGREDLKGMISFEDQFGSVTGRVFTKSLYPSFLLVALHGYGGNRECLQEIVGELQDRHAKALQCTTIIFLEGLGCVHDKVACGVDSVKERFWFSLGNHQTMFHWAANYAQAHLNKEPNMEVNYVRDAIVIAATRWSVRYDNIGLLGFSQGGMVVQEIALQLPQYPGYIGIWSGSGIGLKGWAKRIRLLRESNGDLDKQLLQSMRQCVYIQSHSRRDMTLPWQLGRSLWKFIKEEVNASNRIFLAHSGGHTVPYHILMVTCSLFANFCYKKLRYQEKPTVGLKYQTRYEAYPVTISFRKMNLKLGHIKSIILLSDNETKYYENIWGRKTRHYVQIPSRCHPSSIKSPIKWYKGSHGGRVAFRRRRFSEWTDEEREAGIANGKSDWHYPYKKKRGMGYIKFKPFAVDFIMSSESKMIDLFIRVLPSKLTYFTRINVKNQQQLLSDGYQFGSSNDDAMLTIKDVNGKKYLQYRSSSELSLYPNTKSDIHLQYHVTMRCS